MLKGLPASGKTTHALELVKLGWKRVNKDDMRAMVDNKKWSRSNEKEILACEKGLVKFYLKKGHNVVVDDTNFAHETTWEDIAKDCEADFEIKFFDVQLWKCIERDAKRGEKSVGAEVIASMYDKYLWKPVVYDPQLPDCYIFDIDGTLAQMNGRSPYDYEKVNTDSLNIPVANVFKSLKEKKFIFSGRKDICHQDTVDWLLSNGLESYYDLFMRETGDDRKDYIVKREIYERYIKGKYNVIGVFDDRLQVCRMWYELGLPLFRVGNPDRNF